MQHHLYEMDPGVALKRFERHTVTLDVRAGGLECHHPYLPHSSLPNASDGNRRAIILRFQPDTEPVVAGPFRHWQTGEMHRSINYLVRGSHPLLDKPKMLKRDGGEDNAQAEPSSGQPSDAAA